MEVKVFTISGTETGKTVQLPSEIFGITPNDHAMYLDVKQYLANQRQGTHKSKVKAEVNYSTRKIKKQKGTGGARAGSIKSGVFVGGGRIHGPQPRDYSFKLNKKLKRLAKLSALSYKATNNNILVLDSVNFDKPSTKSFNEVLSNLKLNNQRVLFVTPDLNSNLHLSSRNILKAETMRASDINTYQILKAKTLVLLNDSIEVLKQSIN
ncbi:MAG: 50S ribosomal protein L4 [Bacteroidota bacterium]|nr:50S ribosomal protein L4 [Bacteroidota bacterium]